MNMAGSIPSGWSTRRWTAVLVSLLAAHAAGLWWFGAHQRLPTRQPDRVPEWTLADPRITALWPLLDPTLFVQGHPQSFSGPAWMRLPEVTYQPTIPLEPPRFLVPTAARVAQSFQNTWVPRGWNPSPMAIRVQPPPQTGGLVPRSPLTDRPSRLSLTDWDEPVRLRTPPPSLPGWAAPDLLTNTVVRVLVEPSGRVLSAVLVSSSGWEPADQYALATAQQLEFDFPNRPTTQTPAPAEPIRGILIFQWQTLPPPQQPEGPG